MFNFKKDKVLYAPMKGKSISISDVPDQIFAQKLMGDGIAFVPDCNYVVSPCDGEITMIAVTKHAIGITNKDGLEILIHIGLDTVNYQGKGFSSLVKEGQKIKKGIKLIEFDKEFFEKENVNLITPMIITNGSDIIIEESNINENIEFLDKVIQYSRKE